MQIGKYFWASKKLAIKGLKKNTKKRIKRLKQDNIYKVNV